MPVQCSHVRMCSRWDAIFIQVSKKVDFRKTFRMILVHHMDLDLAKTSTKFNLL